MENTHSVYLGCNHKYAELLGLDNPQDIIGKTDYEIGWLPDGDAAVKFRSGDQEMLSGHAITNHEEWLSLKTGAKICTLISKVPLLNANGDIQGILGVATDIIEKNTSKKIWIKPTTSSKA